MWSSSPMATHSGHPEDALSSWAPQNLPHLRLPQDCSDCPYWDCLCHVCPAGSCGVHGAGQGGLCLLYPGYPNAEPSHLQSEKQGCEGCPVETGVETHSHLKEGDQRGTMCPEERTRGLWGRHCFWFDKFIPHDPIHSFIKHLIQPFREAHHETRTQV